MTEFGAECWRISGALTVREVPDAFAESKAGLGRGGMPAEIDLSSVSDTDSSALALMLEWASWARRAGVDTVFRDPPESLRVLAGLSDVAGLLGWAEEGGGA